MSRVDEICPLAFQKQTIISMHITSLVKIHWYLLKLSPGNENPDVPRADYCHEMTNFPISNSKQISTISMNISFVKIHWVLLKYHPERKLWTCRGQITLSKTDKICPLAIRSSQYQCIHQDWNKSIDIYSSYHPETKIRTDGRSYGWTLIGYSMLNFFRQKL